MTPLYVEWFLRSIMIAGDSYHDSWWTTTVTECDESSTLLSFLALHFCCAVDQAIQSHLLSPLANTTLCQNGSVRLTSGTSHMGRLEVCLGGTFGSVCGENWNTTGASVACRQLGLPSQGTVQVGGRNIHMWVEMCMCQKKEGGGAML